MDSSRAQSEVVGFVLVIGLVIASTGVIVAIGADSISGTQDVLDTERAETALAQLDSQAALVALGSSEVQEVDLPAVDRTSYRIYGDAGWMNISFKNASTGKVRTIHNATLGSVTYEGVEGTTIAYQGGGVWRQDEGNGSVMISPPEFHYRSATLTLPLVTVRGDDRVTSKATITQSNTTRFFPNRSISSDFRNPLSGGKVTVTVHSKYYRAWGNYFEQRTDGTVTYEDDEQTAIIELTVPFNEDFSDIVVSTKPNGITSNGADPIPTPYREGVAYPDADSRIEDTINDCETTSTCTDKPTGSPVSISSPGTYFIDGDFSNSISVTSPGDNVTIVIDGSYEPAGVTLTGISSNHGVDVMVREDFAVSAGDNVNDPGIPGEFRVLVHSDGDVDFNGKYKFNGLVYAPKSECDLNGGGGPSFKNVIGGVVCETMDINGNPNKFEYHSSIEDISFDLDPPNVTPITYLHISDNEIEVDS